MSQQSLRMRCLCNFLFHVYEFAAESGGHRENCRCCLPSSCSTRGKEDALRSDQPLQANCVHESTKIECQITAIFARETSSLSASALRLVRPFRSVFRCSVGSSGSSPRHSSSNDGRTVTITIHLVFTRYADRSWDVCYDG